VAPVAPAVPFEPVAPVAPAAPFDPVAPVGPVAPAAPVAPVGPASVSTNDKYAAWLVLVASLLSNCTLAVPLATMRNPLLLVGVVTHPCTADVASTVINASVVETLTLLATVAPAVGVLLPFTPDSVQGPFPV
jgi:hypothetical protein